MFAYYLHIAYFVCVYCLGVKKDVISRRKVTDKDDTNTDLERGLAHHRPSTTTSTTQLSNPTEAVQVLIQTMEESRRIEHFAMEERHREAEKRQTIEMEVKEESRRAEYRAIE